MRKNRSEGKGGASGQGGFTSAAMGQMNPELISKMVRENPEFIISMMGALDPKAMAEAVNQNPGMFSEVFGAMPRSAMKILLTEQPDFIFDMLRHIDPEIVMDMMGLED